MAKLVKEAPSLLAPAMAMIDSLEFLRAQRKSEVRKNQMSERYKRDLISKALVGGGYGKFMAKRAAEYLHRVLSEGDAVDGGEVAFEQAHFFCQSPNEFDPAVMCIVPGTTKFGIALGAALQGGEDPLVQCCHSSSDSLGPARRRRLSG